MPVKPDRNRRSQYFRNRTKREDRLESDPSEPDRQQPTFVREPKTAERLKFVLAEIVPVVLKDETAILDHGRGSRRARIVRVLEQLRENMPWVLDLFKEQPPRTTEFPIALNLVPPVLCPGANGIEKMGLCPHELFAGWRCDADL